MTVRLTSSEQGLLRRAIEISERARADGNHPFGALLADPSGLILIEAENTVVTDGDPTGHAETNLVRLAAGALSPDVIARATVFTSYEPCAMCAGAMYWGGISRMIYGMTELDLLKATGHHPENPTMTLDCRVVLGVGQREIEVVGPALAAEAIVAHEGFRV